MIKQLKSFLASISMKLFLGFWLIALLSVFTTRFISAQFKENNIILPAHPIDIRQLTKTVRHNKRNPAVDVGHFLKRQLKKKRRLAKDKPMLLLKNSRNNHIVTLDKKNKPYLANYLEKNLFSKALTIQFSRARVTGPVDIVIAKQSYQLYLARNIPAKHNKQFANIIMEIPLWGRIAIPLIISFILCWLLARSISKPLTTIQHVANKLGDGDLSTRLTTTAQRNDELGSLARSFNNMAEKLEQSISAQQRLLGDISHELRSPMTRLQLALGLAQKKPISAESLEKYLSRSELEVTRLDEMIANVLILSRLENAIHTLHLEQLDLILLLKTLQQDAQFIANEKSITIDLNIKLSATKHCIILADSQLLASAISNVLNNAVKYSPNNSEINIQLIQTTQQIVVTISDTGSGVPPQDIEHLFEPFYRVASARDRKTGGTGLGLAIAKQALQAHKGSIIAKNNKPIGLTVIISLPANTTAKNV